MADDSSMTTLEASGRSKRLKESNFLASARCLDHGPGKGSQGSVMIPRRGRVHFGDGGDGGRIKVEDTSGAFEKRRKDQKEISFRRHFQS